MAVQGNEQYPLALAAGSILNGRYIVQSVLGQGGFGITYLARDVQTEETVAIKEYFPETLVTRKDGHTVMTYSAQRQENFDYGLRCFLSEAQTLAQFIGVANIVCIHQYFEENSTAYFVMDYIDGISLQTYLEQEGGRIGWERTKTILFPVMDALSEVHARGIIHRDISPDNIILTRDGGVKLLDFGSARYSLGDKSRSLDIVLKHGYAPVEQYTRRGRQGPFTDIYSLAATMYFCQTGRIPPEAIDRMGTDEWIPPSILGSDIPPQAEEALAKALAVQASDRYQSMEEFVQALQAAEAMPEPAREMAPRRKRGKKLWLLAAAALLVTALAAIPIRMHDDTKTVSVNPSVERMEDTVPAMMPELPTETYAIETYPAETEPTVLNIQSTPQLLSAKGLAMLAIREDGTVAKAGGLDPKTWHAVSSWEDLISVHSTGSSVVGLKADGTAVATGIPGQYDTDAARTRWDVSGWTDLKAIGISGAPNGFTVGLKKDGTLVTTGDTGELDLSEWPDIADISVSYSCILGLKTDGTVLSAGSFLNAGAFVDLTDEFDEWTNIISVACSHVLAAGLRSDGTVLVAGNMEQGKNLVSTWKDITAIAAGKGHIVGLKKDGTVIATGSNFDGECNVQDWTDIVAIEAGGTIGGGGVTVGLKKDGTLVFAGTTYNGVSNVSGISGLRIPG